MPTIIVRTHRALRAFRPSARQPEQTAYFTTIVPRMPAAKWPGNVHR